MARKIPADFDPERYRAEYPDVALSGLEPAEHYLLFGRIMGRRSAPARELPVTPAPESTKAKPEPTKAKPDPPEPNETRPAENPLAPKERPKPIIDRPADFEPEQTLIRPAPPKPGADKNGRFALARLAEEVAADAGHGLGAFRRMFGIDAAKNAPAIGLGAAQILRGPARVENAWLTADGVLRLMIADYGGETGGWTVRAYDADAAEPAQLQLLGPGASLPERGPVLVEFQLRHRLMPLLLEIANGSGAVKEVALLPFPSLLPGGHHNAELRALQSEANPMDAFWSLSDLLLRELVGEPNSSELSIGRLSRFQDAEAATSALDGDIEQWLTAVFGFQRSEGDGKSLARRNGAADLLLPSDCIPTISSLVSRSLSGRGTGPYLVADSETLRPRWSVVLPAAWDAKGTAPVVRPSGRDGAPSVHVAIALRAPPAPSLSTGSARKKSRARRKLSVLLDATHPDRSKAAVAALRTAIGSELDLLVRVSGEEASFRSVIDGAWKVVDEDLPGVAAQAKHDQLLTITDQVDLSDGSVLDTLAGMLKNKKVASASCLLLREVLLKKQKVLQPATGGLFPAGVSFATSPSLTFAEPDVQQALPDLTYPVVANTLQLTLWRTSALASLPRPSRPLPASASDISIGLALAERGLVSLCTTKVSARLNGDYEPRDAIDPIGQSRLSPQDWQQLLGCVTLLRQMF